MPSIQKILLALAFAATAFAAQISDGQIQQPTSTPVIVPAVKQITDGQIQQVSTTPAAVVTPAVKQITDGQIQQVASASITPSVSANVTSVTTPSAPATFTGAASLMGYSTELMAIGAVAVFAML